MHERVRILHNSVNPKSKFSAYPSALQIKDCAYKGDILCPVVGLHLLRKCFCQSGPAPHVGHLPQNRAREMDCHMPKSRSYIRINAYAEEQKEDSTFAGEFVKTEPVRWMYDLDASTDSTKDPWAASGTSVGEKKRTVSRATSRSIGEGAPCWCRCAWCGWFWPLASAGPHIPAFPGRSCMLFDGLETGCCPCH